MKHVDSPIVKLTQSQENAVTTCIDLLPEYKIILIRGDSGTGKYVVATEIFRRLDAVVENFDLCELAKSTKMEMSGQHIVEYLEIILSRVVNKLESSNKKSGIIYFRYYDRIADVLSDCYSKLRFLLPLVLRTFSDAIPDNVKILITSRGFVLPEGIHWSVDLETTRKDMEYILKPFYESGVFTDDELQYIMKISKIVSVGRILYSIKYATTMTRCCKEKPSSNNNNFIDFYKKALSKFSESTIDIDKDVPQPNPDYDLVGVDDILDEITTSIINPMRLCIPGIHIKKGILLCGPPGTGKTTIGRWLAHQIKGKFYLIGGEVGVNGSCLIKTFQNTVRKAKNNAPSVVFVDDGDLLFDHADTYRAFLTILDGVDSNQRSDVCVILTCMNMRKVPSSLLRGGRLEMAIMTRLPDNKKIQTIIERSLNKMADTLDDYDHGLYHNLSTHITHELIDNLSHKMSGWNYADIHRCVNDVSRMIVSNKGTNLIHLFDICIRRIREQYKLCGICESTNIDFRPYDTYIT